MTKDSKYWKHPQYGMVYMGEVVTPRGNICWPGGLAKPKDAPPAKEGEKQGAPRYEGTLILDKSDPEVIKFVNQLEALTDGGLKLFNEKRSATISIASIFGKYGDGDSWDLEKYPYYKNKWVMVARNVEQPKIVDYNRGHIEPTDIKGGMPGRFVATPLITAHGVSYKLLIVQKFEGEYQPMAGGAREVMDLLADLEEDKDVSESQTEVEPEAKPNPVGRPKTKSKSDAVNLLA